MFTSCWIMSRIADNILIRGPYESRSARRAEKVDKMEKNLTSPSSGSAETMAQAEATKPGLKKGAERVTDLYFRQSVVTWEWPKALPQLQVRYTFLQMYKSLIYQGSAVIGLIRTEKLVDPRHPLFDAKKGGFTMYLCKSHAAKLSLPSTNSDVGTPPFRHKGRW